MQIRLNLELPKCLTPNVKPYHLRFVICKQTDMRAKTKVKFNVLIIEEDWISTKFGLCVKYLMVRTKRRRLCSLEIPKIEMRFVFFE